MVEPALQERTPADGAPARTRTHSWPDPAPSQQAMTRLSGLELLAAMAAGELPPPPLMSTLGFTLETFEHGRVAFGMVPAEFHHNPLGTVHGGVLATLLDSAAGCAVHSTLPAGTGYTSLDLSVRFVRPLVAGAGAVRAEGRVLAAGRRTAVAEATVVDGRGRLVAHATSTCLIVPLGGDT
jgi:uncharacterized protein (TIGR00369 family)